MDILVIIPTEFAKFQTRETHSFGQIDSRKINDRAI